VHAYIIRRIVTSVIVLLIVTMLVFVVVRLLPGDPILMYISQEQLSDATPEYIAGLRAKYGLDQSLPMQYIQWLGNLVLHGDFGTSIVMATPVRTLIEERLPVSFHMGAIAFIIGIPFGIGAGVLCAVRRASWVDTMVTSLANIGVCVPVFWLGILMVYLFSLELKWLPTFGYTSPFEDFWLNTKQIIMPIVCLAIPGIAGNCRLSRSSMLEVMRQDYIRTAWSKGLKERVIVLKHALKNGIAPIITMAGMGVATVIGGSVLIETVFNIPGMGRLSVSGVLTHDYPIIQGNVVIFAILVLASNLIVDLCYGWLDPRIRYG